MDRRKLGCTAEVSEPDAEALKRRCASAITSLSPDPPACEMRTDLNIPLRWSSLGANSHPIFFTAGPRSLTVNFFKPSETSATSPKIDFMFDREPRICDQT